MPPQGGQGSDVLLHEDLAFDLDRLFDDYNMDHIPVEHHLDGFKKRDLPLVKHYKAAVNIFGGPVSRKRVIIAPPMETPLKHKLGMYINKSEFPPAPVLNSIMQPPRASGMETREVTEFQEMTKEEASYKKWFSERKALQENLSKMGLSEDLLRRKADKTELELRVQARLKAARTWKPKTPPPPERELKARGPPVMPNVRAPMPASLQTLDRFLVEHKMRLIDLFTNADRNKDWRLTKQELKKAIEKYRIPLSQGDIEDLIVMLDQDFDECLGYAEVARGLAVLRTERRMSKRRGEEIPETRSSPSHVLSRISSISYARDSNQSHYSDMVMKVAESPALVHPGTRGSPIAAEDTREKPEKRVGSACEAASNAESVHRSGSNTSTSNSLEPPPRDLREECRVAGSEEERVELRKRERFVLERANARKWPLPVKGKDDDAPGVIRIGQRAVDEHCMESTLGGEAGALLNAFRQNSLKEYFQVVEVCRENGLVLTPQLLDRVLLYPPELPHSELMKHLRIPGGGAADLSINFTKSPQQQKIAQESQRKEKVIVSNSGVHLARGSHSHAQDFKLTLAASGENWSTEGEAVAHKSGQGMTFEEYANYTKRLPVRYKELTKGGRGGGKGKYTEGAGAEERGGKGTKTDAYGGPKAGSRTHKKSSRSPQNLSVFWPGYMLDKLVLCIPLLDKGPGPWSRGSSTHFHYTGQPKPAYPAKYYV